MELSRVTKHKKPKHQLYQPGFNDANGCWLDGTWITVPAEEFTARKKAHEKLYKNVAQESKAQSHRGKRVALKDMTPAQRLAWEHYSGERTLEVRYPSGEVGGVGVRMAGRRVAESALKWLREKQAKVIPRVLQPGPKGKVVEDQTKLVPADLLSDDVEPVDVWKLVVKQNKERFRALSKASAELALGQTVHVEGREVRMPSDLMGGVAVQNLFALEEQIIRNEKGKTPDHYESPEETLAEYVEHRKEMKEALGEQFEAIYREAKKSHNACARTNLDNSDGHLFCFVLPEFHDDGSHEPVGPRDYPWAQKDL